MPTTEVKYFGYGANRDADMIKALLGRVPSGKPAKLFAYKLYVQEWDEIPNEVKKVLAPPWDRNFKTYIVSPSESSKDFVSGVLWDITRDERRILDAWEVTGKWYDTSVLQYQGDSGNYIQIEVPMIKNSGNSKISNGRFYKNYINSKKKMISVAEKLRTDIIN